VRSQKEEINWTRKQWDYSSHTEELTFPQGARANEDG